MKIINDSLSFEVFIQIKLGIVASKTELFPDTCQDANFRIFIE